MHYIASALHGASVSHALKTDFLQPDVDALIQCKANRIQVHALDPNGLRLATEIALFATIAEITAIKLKDRNTSSLAVLTTRHDLILLSYDSQSNQITTDASTSVLERGGRLSETCRALVADKLGRFLVIYEFSGLLHFIMLDDFLDNRKSKRTRLSNSNQAAIDLSRGFTIRLSELTIEAIQLLPHIDPDKPPTLLSVHIDRDGRHVFLSRTIDFTDKSLSMPQPNEQVIINEEGDYLLFPVASKDVLGAITIGEDSATFIELSSNDSDIPISPKGKGKRRESASGSTSPIKSKSFGRVKCTLPIGQYTGWTAVEDQSGTYIIGDECGYLTKLHLICDESGKVDRLQTTDLGQASSVASLVYLTNNFLYIGSHYGDSQLVQLPDASSMEVDTEDGNSALTTINTFSSLSPLVDFCVQKDSLGHAQVVACCGRFDNGTIRIIRHGVGLTEHASLDLGGIQKIWSLKTNPQTEYDNLFVLSSSSETRMLAIEGCGDEAGIEEVAELQGIDAANPTIDVVVCQVGELASFIVHVNAHRVAICETGSSDIMSWKPELSNQRITLAKIFDNNVLVALSDGNLHWLEISPSGISLQQSLQLSNEAACLSVDKIGDQLIAAVGTWKTHEICLYSLPTFSQLASTSIDTPFHLRSMLFATFYDGSSTLFVGTGDGKLASMSLLQNENGIELGSVKTTPLGSTPVTLQNIELEGETAVFVTCDRSTIVSKSGGRLNFAAVNVEKLATVAASNTPLYPTSLLIASPDSLKIGNITEVQKLHTQTVPMNGEQPRRIAHSDHLGAYGVVCMREKLDRETGDYQRTCSVKVFDAISWQVIASIKLRENEEGRSIFAHTLEDGSQVFVIGTGYVNESETQPSSGRLLVYGHDDTGNWELLGFTLVDGIVHSIAGLSDHHVACAVNAQVVIYKIAEKDTIVRVASWTASFIANTITTHDNSIIVGDALRSMTLLEFNPTDSKITLITRDLSAYGLTNVAALKSDLYIAAELDMNLFTLKKDVGPPGTMSAGLPILAQAGMFHLGEIVTKFAHGSLIPAISQAQQITSEHLLFSTSSGSIGTIFEVSDGAAQILSALERNMRRIKGAGNLDHSAWRSYTTDYKTMPAAGMIDGDFVETFLEMDEATQDEILKGGSVHEAIAEPRSDVIRLLEDMHRAH